MCRQSGRTTAICEAAKSIGAIIVAASRAHAQVISTEHGGIETISMDQLYVLRGRHKPVLWDHFATEELQRRVEAYDHDRKTEKSRADRIVAENKRLRAEIARMEGKKK